MACFSCLKLLDCGLLCEGLWSDFQRQSRGCDFMHVLQCLVSVPLSALLAESNSGLRWFIKLVANIYKRLKFHRVPLKLATAEPCLWIFSVGFQYTVINHEAFYHSRDGTPHQIHHPCIHSHCAAATAGPGSHIQRIVTHSSRAGASQSDVTLLFCRYPQRPSPRLTHCFFALSFSC